MVWLSEESLLITRVTVYLVLNFCLFLLDTVMYPQTLFAHLPLEGLAILYATPGSVKMKHVIFHLFISNRYCRLRCLDLKSS